MKWSSRAGEPIIALGSYALTTYRSELIGEMLLRQRNLGLQRAFDVTQAWCRPPTLRADGGGCGRPRSYASEYPGAAFLIHVRTGSVEWINQDTDLSLGFARSRGQDTLT